MSTAGYTDEELAREVIDRCERIEDTHHDNDAALEFAGGVRETAESMLGSIEEYGHATPNMRAALENMFNGAGGWLGE